MSPILILIITILLMIIVSSLPLYFAVKLLGGDASILKVFFTNVVVVLVTMALVSFIGGAGFLIFLVTIIFYSIIFRMGLIRSLLAYISQFVIAAVLFVLAVLFIPALAVFF